MIPVNEPLLDGNEKKYLCECVDTGWLSSDGPFVKRFEDDFANFVGVRHGIAVSNGTAAIETALYAIGVGKNDEVIMPSFTIISCAIGCIRLGAKPILVDIDPQTWTMDVSQIESKITEHTKAIMPVHIYGHPVRMDKIIELSKKYNLLVIEDAAEAHGAKYFSQISGGKWLNCGGIGHISATSFYANKIITTGEGGMVLTNDDLYAEKARSYRNLCFRPEQRFYHTSLGYNFRMTNLQAAVGLAQLENIDKFLKIKAELAEYYKEKLSMINGIRFMNTENWASSVYWMYAVELDPHVGYNAKQMINYLSKNGVSSRPFFLGLHKQPALNDLGLFISEKYPLTEHASEYGLYLPSGLALSKNQINDVIRSIAKILNCMPS